MNNSLAAMHKKIDDDLNIIVMATLIVTALYMGYQENITAFAANTNVPVFLRTLLLSIMQFGLAGLGITIVFVYRKERVAAYGLHLKGALRSIGLCSLCFLPRLLYLFVTNQIHPYAPFSILITDDIMSSSFIEKFFSMLLIAVVWGFFEGYNYVVISDKINLRYPAENKWLNWGAVTCSILGIFIHGGITATSVNMFEVITVIISIYGMLLVKKLTNNSWGCIFIHMFLWNAF